MDKCWILTREHNQYDQMGEYFVCVFNEKPDFEKLVNIVLEWYEPMDNTDPTPEHVTGNLLRQGGGRIWHEDTWLHLRETEMK